MGLNPDGCGDVVNSRHHLRASTNSMGMPFSFGSLPGKLLAGEKLRLSISKGRRLKAEASYTLPES